MSVEERIKSLEIKVQKLQERPKDAWDKVGIVAAALVPVAIAFFGNALARQMHDSELAVESHRTELEQDARRREAAHQASMAEINARVAQVGVVSSFFEALVSNDVRRRKVAIRAVLIAMPIEGPIIVQELAEADADEQIRAEAQQALAERAKTLTESLFAKSARTREAAASQLTSGAWRKSIAVVEPLVAAAEKNPQNAAGVAKAAEVVENLDQSVIDAKRPAFRTVCTKIAKIKDTDVCVEYRRIEESTPAIDPPPD